MQRFSYYGTINQQDDPNNFRDILKLRKLPGADFVTFRGRGPLKNCAQKYFILRQKM